MNLNFKEVEAPVAYKQGLGLGVHEVAISGVVFDKEKNDKQTPYANIGFVNDEGDFEDKFHLTPKALSKLKHLMTEAGVSADLLNNESVTTDQVAAVLTGKKVRIRISGKEYPKQDGSVGTARELGFAGFAESLSVTKADSKLSTTPYTKKLAVVATPVNNGVKDDGLGLPF